MAIRTNTTRTIDKASSALGARGEATQKNMDKLAAQAGCSGCTMEKVTLPLAPGSSDDVVFVGLNGADFYFMRGRQVEMPAPIAEILRNTGNL